MNTHRMRRSEGSTFAIAMILSLVIFILSAAFLLMISYEFKLNRNSVRRAVALNIAEAGTDYGFWAVQSSGRRTGWSGTSPIVSPLTNLSTSSGQVLGQFQIKAWPTTSPSNTWLVETVGYVPNQSAAQNASRTVKVKVAAAGGSGPFIMGFFGDNSVNFTGSVICDSYDSRLGAYGGSNIGTNGDIGTNGSAITVTGSGTVKGDVRCFGTTSTGNVNLTGSGNITGDIITKGNTGRVDMSGSGTINGNIRTTGTTSSRITGSGSYIINGNIAASSTGSGAISFTGSTTVNGNAATGPGGTVSLSGSSRVNGSTTHDQATETPDAARDMTPKTVPSNLVSLGYPAWQSDGLVTLTGSSSRTLPSGDYKLRRIRLTGSTSLTIGVAGQETNIYLTGYSGDSIAQSGSSIITCNGKVTIYTDAKISSSGSGLWNPTNTPPNCIIYGTASCSGSVGVIQMSGSRDLYGAIYAPLADITVSGSGATYGSFIGKTIVFNGSGGFHYDEALGALSGGAATSYSVEYWQEK